MLGQSFPGAAILVYVFFAKNGRCKVLYKDTVPVDVGKGDKGQMDSCCFQVDNDNWTGARKKFKNSMHCRNVIFKIVIFFNQIKHVAIMKFF